MIAVYTTFIIHVTTFTCFGYIYVTIIQLDIPLYVKLQMYST